MDAEHSPQTSPPPDPVPAQERRDTRSPARGRLTVAAVLGVPLGGFLFLTWFWISLSLLSAGLGSLLAAGAGLLLLIPWVLLMRGAIWLEQLRAVSVHRMPVITPRRRRSTREGFTGWLHDLWLDVTSGAFWRGVLHHHLAMVVAGIFSLLALALLTTAWMAVDIAVRYGPLEISGVELSRPALVVVAVVIAVLAIGVLILGALADRGLARGLISGSEDELREQVTEMSLRRQGAVDAAAQERLRIERDLHDGVQPRLVALAMTLGRAKQAIPTDPQRATALVDHAHSEAKAVVTDLRQLARGIHPAVLTDRGLDAALSALAARSPVPVRMQVRMTGPVDREQEAVAYFVVAEALTNIAKHAAATTAEVTVLREGPDGALHVRVADDGRGGAAIRRDGVSTGLAGLADRVRATGGRLEVAKADPGTERPGTVLTALIPRSTAPAAPTGRPLPQEATR